MSESRDDLAWVAGEITGFHQSLDHRPVQPPVDAEAIRSALGDLEDAPRAARAVLEPLVVAVTPALTGTAGPRYFGFVVGGALDAALGADLLATGWDQVAFNHLTSPVAAIVEEVAGQ